LSKKVTDSIIIVKNDKLKEISDPNTGMKDAFKIVDNILYQAVNGMSEVILKPGTNDINADFADIKTIMQHTLKIVYIAEETLLQPLCTHLQKTFGNEIEIKLSPENYMGCWFLTILHPLGDKAHALHKLSEYLDIPLTRTTVFGDSINDIEMFKIAGTAVAVSNAVDIVKKEASIILPHKTCH